MFKRNWREIKPISEYDGSCLSRYFFRRKDQLSLEGGYKVTEYLEWVRHVTIPTDKRTPYKKQNIEEILYILQGDGLIQSGDDKYRVSAQDAVYIPSETSYTIHPTIDAQPLIYMNYGIRTPPDAREVNVMLSPVDNKPSSNILVERWTEKKTISGHSGTCQLYPIFTRSQMKYLLFATLMAVPKDLGYHRHNTEAIYFISSGMGSVKVAGEEAEVRDGDAVYIPPGIAHKCKPTVEGHPLNVFCQGVAVPYDAEVWTIEDLPDLPI
ncbi:MAG: cupin domain-containing protein [Nitrososphaeria archaeon]